MGDSIDFSLVKLSVPPPYSYNVYYAGWDRSEFQTSGSTTIHHPWGDVKKISFDHDVPSTPAHPSDVPYADLNDYRYFSYWWIRNWETGSTEGGSSGSPLFNQGQRVIGILSGGIARCGDSIGYDLEKERIIYDNGHNYDDYYTKMSYAWDYYGEAGPSLMHWLDPVSDGTAFVLGGHLPTGIDPLPENRTGTFRLYPNPVSGILQVECISGEPHAFYRIFDLSGTLRASGLLEGTDPWRINTASLRPGAYVISFDAGGTAEHHQFLVIR